MPETHLWKVTGLHHPSREDLGALRQHSEDGLSQSSELLSKSPPRGKDKVSPVGLACSISYLLMVLAMVTPSLNPLPPHLDGTSSQTTKHKASPDPEHIKLRVPCCPTLLCAMASANNSQTTPRFQLQLTSDVILSPNSLP